MPCCKIFRMERIQGAARDQIEFCCLNYYIV
jgi:hypothetical protein